MRMLLGLEVRLLALNDLSLFLTRRSSFLKLEALPCYLSPRL